MSCSRLLRQDQLGWVREGEETERGRDEVTTQDTPGKTTTQHPQRVQDNHTFFNELSIDLIELNKKHFIQKTLQQIRNIGWCIKS